MHGVLVQLHADLEYLAEQGHWCQVLWKEANHAPMFLIQLSVTLIIALWIAQLANGETGMYARLNAEKVFRLVLVSQSSVDHTVAVLVQC